MSNLKPNYVSDDESSFDDSGFNYSFSPGSQIFVQLEKKKKLKIWDKRGKLKLEKNIYKSGNFFLKIKIGCPEFHFTIEKK